MKFAVIFTAILGAFGASADILKSYSQHRPQKHQVARATQPQTSGRKTSNAKFAVAAAASQESTIGGAVVAAPNVASATGTFQVPEARQPTKGPTGNNPITYGASFWVGIDGVAACTAASLRAGIDIFWDPEGTSYNTWYQLAPARSVDFPPPLDIEPGDTVRITASAGGGNSSSSVMFENLSTGQSAAQTFEAAPGLCRSEAAWVVEDFVLEQSVGLPVPLVDFNNVTFSAMAAAAAPCASSRANGIAAAAAPPSPISLEGAVVVNINQAQQGGQLTDCARSGDELVCRRIYGSS